MVAKLSYEESRRKRLEENKKRMQALNLPLLSQTLRNSPSPKPSLMKQVKPLSIEKKDVVVRRSNRVANIAAPVYNGSVIDRVAIPRRAITNHYSTTSQLSKHPTRSNREVFDSVKMVAKLSYEESRRKRLEENKKRMEALNLHLLSQALRNSPAPKPSLMKQVKPRSIEKKDVVLRRSNRVANVAAPVYDGSVIDRGRIYKKPRDLTNWLFASEEARIEACKKAEKLESDLESEYPTFYKSMLPSHVSGGFWLGLPVDFCERNLPKSSEVMTLIDEDGDEYPTTYLVRQTGLGGLRKTGLSGGWKGFAVAHNLADGDAVVFQLIRRTAFKVYIIRANGPREKV